MTGHTQRAELGRGPTPNAPEIRYRQKPARRPEKPLRQRQGPSSRPRQLPGARLAAERPAEGRRPCGRQAGGRWLWLRGRRPRRSFKPPSRPRSGEAAPRRAWPHVGLRRSRARPRGPTAEPCRRPPPPHTHRGPPPASPRRPLSPEPPLTGGAGAPHTPTAAAAPRPAPHGPRGGPGRSRGSALPVTRPLGAATSVPRAPAARQPRPGAAALAPRPGHMAAAAPALTPLAARVAPRCSAPGRHVRAGAARTASARGSGGREGRGEEKGGRGRPRGRCGGSGGAPGR